MKRKIKTRDVITLVILVVALITMVVAGFNIVKTLLDYHAGEEEYRKLKEMVFSMGEETSEAEDSIGEPIVDPEAWRDGEAICRAVASLKDENKDVVAWIAFDNLDISYPVVQGEDNDKYLRHTISGAYNTAGSIFMEALNHYDFQDIHTILYGHNMKNLTMFGKLKYYRDDGFYEDHQYFTIYTVDRIYRYQIFAYYDIPETSDIYDIYFESVDEIQEFITKLYRHSYYNTGVEVYSGDRIITLSTCSSEGNRFVVNAVRIGEQIVEN